MRRFLFPVITLLTFLFLSTFIADAGGNNTQPDVTWIVDGKGPTEEEAIKSACRSAIEQAYGAFVSTDTKILNDNIVKDEIVLISRGNIKKYDKIASVILPNGAHQVTLRVTVSTSNLVSYARSKGARVELAGQTFAMNMKLMDLRENNTVAALGHMCEQIEILAPNAFDYSLFVGDPTIQKETMYSFSYAAGYQDGRRIGEPDGYVSRINVRISANETTEAIHNLVCGTLAALSLTPQERMDYYKKNRKVMHVGWRFVPHNEDEACVVLPISDAKNIDAVLKLVEHIQSVIASSIYGYTIVYKGKSNDSYKWTHIRNKNNVYTYPDLSRRAAHYGFVNNNRNGINTSNLYLTCEQKKKIMGISYGKIGDLITKECTAAEAERTYNFFNFDKWGDWCGRKGTEAVQNSKEKSAKNKGKGKKDSGNKSVQKTTYGVLYTHNILWFIPKDEMSYVKGFEVKKAQ
ncbi:MAG: hypothetical protein IKP46_01845 [Bacteroidales bacterium]|nr:hypothetical protein [Bacteroidales bacterium]